MNEYTVQKFLFIQLMLYGGKGLEYSCVCVPILHKILWRTLKGETFGKMFMAKSMSRIEVISFFLLFSSLFSLPNTSCLEMSLIAKGNDVLNTKL